MTTQTLPNLRAFIDWDGDGWINKGVTTDPLNLAFTPLTLQDMVKLNTTPATVKYANTSRGLYEHRFTLVGPQTLYVGYNKGSAGQYVALFTPTQTGTYTVQMYVKTGIAGTLTITAKNVYPAPSNTTNITQTPLAFSAINNYTLLTYTFTVNNLANMQIGLELTNSASLGTCAITGLQVMYGNYPTEIPFNVGTPISRLDNVSSYLISANWQLGATNPSDTACSEGSATLVLNNTSRIFSPENTASFLYSYNSSGDPNYPQGRYPHTSPDLTFADGTTVSIEVQNPSTLAWVEMWRGFIYDYSVDTAVSGLTATITANQGIFRLDQSKINVGLLSAFEANNPLDMYTSHWLIKFILENYAVSSKIPNVATVGKTGGLNTKYYDIISPSGIYSVQQPSSYEYSRTYTSAKAAWSDSPSAMAAIRDLMQLDQGFFYIGRDGVYNYIQRNSLYTDLGTDIVFDDTSTNTSEYSIQQPLYNAVEVTYTPNNTQSGVVWQSKTPIEVGAKTTVTYTAKFEQPEGKKLAVTSINSFKAAASPSTAIATNSTGSTLAKQSFLISVVLKSAEADITITNVGVIPMKVSVTLNGTYNITSAALKVVKSTKQTINILGSKLLTVNSKLIADADTASQYASFMLEVFGKKYASITSMSLTSRDATWLNNILNYGIGTRIKFRDASSGNIYHRGTIIGESARWSSGILTMDYTLKPTSHVAFNTAGNTYYKYGGLVY